VKNRPEGAYHHRAAASRQTRLAWKDEIMSWTAPIVVEVCAGLEVTAYLTAEM
jgi:coenzyme PQQ precursor peptide PqqA